ncbi:thymidylate synthase [Kribbella alba]|uniref:thymidylate synthase n=1 Tax=Kribbella alba TaxID=190197 RepID=A0ABP4QTP7_9ACTN
MVIVLRADTLDDLLREAIETILNDGELTNPTKGPALDVCGAVLTLDNPLARLSRSEGRGRLFSSLGELCWYLSGHNDLSHIAYYISTYSKFAEEGVIHGGYGPRLFAFDGINQVEYVVNTLRKKPSSRRAVIQLFDHSDVAEHHEDVPCTCTMQFLIRGNKLQLLTYMRSSDTWLGLPHDVFCFTMLQELIARSLSLPVGSYTHFTGSLHLYQRNISAAKAFLAEGWQSTQSQMPEMPQGDQWAAVEKLIHTEELLRSGDGLVPEMLDGSPYWADVARLLAIYALVKQRKVGDVAAIGETMDNSIYDVFIQDKLENIVR